MLHKLPEEWHDTIWFLGGVLSLLCFFMVYWKGEYQNRYAEKIMQEFLSSVAVNGVITLEEYETLKSRLQIINSKYNVEASCVVYEKKPVYALIPQEELTSYYMERNVRQGKEFNKYEPVVQEENPENLRLQKKNNADLISSDDYKLPLPNEDTGWKIEAVKPIQQIYTGENLITICHIVSEEGEYYAEAGQENVMTSGTVYLRLWLENKEYQVPVQVYCYPRIVICENGHQVVNSETILSYGTTIQKTNCPYCEIIPESILCNTKYLHKETGTRLSEHEVWINVTYMNGSTEIVTPDSYEWQDSYDENYCGIQEVTVNYRGKEDKLFVLTENTGCLKCNGVCNERNLSDYIRFPYCVKCMSEVELYSGKTYEEEKVISEGELLAYLDVNSEKNLASGDFIRLYLSKAGRYISYVQERVKRDGKIGENK